MKFGRLVSLFLLVFFMVEIVDPSSAFVRAGNTQGHTTKHQKCDPTGKVCKESRPLTIQAVDNADDDQEQMSHSAVPLMAYSPQPVLTHTSAVWVEAEDGPIDVAYWLHRPPSIT
jgi:hypothetical protein